MSREPGKPARSRGSGRRDGRKSFLAYIDPDVIKALKKAAVDDERNGYEIVEEAVRQWLDRRAAG